MSLRLAWRLAPHDPHEARVRRFAEAARSLGAELTILRAGDPPPPGRLDAVITSDLHRPRTEDAPLFGWLAGARADVIRDPAARAAAASWDGAFAGGETALRFLRSLGAGLGDFAVAADVSPAPAALEAPSDVAGLSRLGLLHGLCAPDVRDAWSEAVMDRLRGHPAFEVRRGGAGPRDYAAAGLGVVLAPLAWAADDAPPPEHLDVCAAGAVPLLPDLPSLRARLGDAPVYYPAARPPEETASWIRRHVDRLLRAPEEARERAAECARRYAADLDARAALARLSDAVERRAANRRRRAAALQETTVDVIVRAGGRPVATLLRALTSIERQTVGRLRVVLVCYRPLDLSEVRAERWSRIVELEVVERPGGGRAETLCAGLRAVRSEFFACLDDDDEWLDDHLESLLPLASSNPPVVAYSGMLRADTAPDGAQSRTLLRSERPGGSLMDVLGVFGIHTVVAPAALLAALSLENWSLSTGEDTALIGSLIARADLRFSGRPTAVVHFGAGDQSDYAAHPERPESLLEAFLRIGPDADRIEQRLSRPPLDFWNRIENAFDQIVHRRTCALAPFWEPDVLVLSPEMMAPPLAERAELQQRAVPLSRFGLHADSRLAHDADGPRLELSPEPWSWVYAASLPLDRADLMDGPQWLVLRFDPPAEPFAASVMNRAQSDHLSRVEIPAADRPVEAWLPVRRSDDVALVAVHAGPAPLQRGPVLRGATLVR